MALAEGRFVTLAVLGVVCLLGAVLTSWLLGQPSMLVFGVVFAGLVLVSLIRPPND
ncbi:hypothetical protein [Geodermatophilus sp. Leaf369]|jgi:hypothetical protein|uniref:hypothetical protein n=1 Tax=Geodermatophilus sp. Leaf369 TaxID=1736354 RepID=UPI0012F76BC1|nr:hypothetical protein [Geodermatophilus sp. Leaf369]